MDKPDPRTTNKITQQNYHLYDYSYHQDPEEIPLSDIQSKQWELTQKQESLRKARDKLGSELSQDLKIKKKRDEIQAMIKELDDQEAKDHMEQITQNLEKLTSRYQVVKILLAISLTLAISVIAILIYSHTYDQRFYARQSSTKSSSYYSSSRSKRSTYHPYVNLPAIDGSVNLPEYQQQPTSTFQLGEDSHIVDYVYFGRSAGKCKVKAKLYYYRNTELPNTREVFPTVCNIKTGECYLYWVRILGMARRSVTYRFHPLKDKDNGITHGDLSIYRTVTDCTVESITNPTVPGKPQFTVNNFASTSPMNFLTSISTDKRINVLLPTYYTITVEKDFADMCARLSFGTTNAIAIIKNLTNLQKNQGTDGLHYCQQENPKIWKPETPYSGTWHAFNKPYLIPNYFKAARPSMYRDFWYQDYIIMKHPDHGNIHNCLKRTKELQVIQPQT